jgi:hypothetical protein
MDELVAISGKAETFWGDRCVLLSDRSDSQCLVD